jgi:hypothetical protein
VSAGRILAGLCGAMLAAGMAVPGAAMYRDDYSTRESRALMHAYAKCVVKRESRRAAEALIRNADNGTILRDYEDLVIEDCLSREVQVTTKMTFGGDLYRYALADALVNRELADRPIPDLAAVPPLSHWALPEPPAPPPPGAKKSARKRYEKNRKDYEEGVGLTFLSRYGECIVRTNPEDAKALLLTTPDSPDEASHFDALRAAFATCLAQGRTYRFTRTVLRGSIAINYYRLARPAQAAAGAGT